MASRRGDFTEVLLFKGVISPEQLAEAQMLASEQGKSVADCLQNLDYATGEEVVRAMAEHHGMRYVDLSSVKIQDNIIELVPEAV
ncbi:MAG: type II/IV secretion system protein, partial [Planctomycetota bacterium]|nr:type II/IV secretion system protein [Planctomycetota bacterium]